MRRPSHDQVKLPRAVYTQFSSLRVLQAKLRFLHSSAPEWSVGHAAKCWILRIPVRIGWPHVLEFNRKCQYWSRTPSEQACRRGSQLPPGNSPCAATCQNCNCNTALETGQQCWLHYGTYMSCGPLLPRMQPTHRLGPNRWPSPRSVIKRLQLCGLLQNAVLPSPLHVDCQSVPLPNRPTASHMCATTMTSMRYRHNLPCQRSVAIQRRSTATRACLPRMPGLLTPAWYTVRACEDWPM